MTPKELKAIVHEVVLGHFSKGANRRHMNSVEADINDTWSVEYSEDGDTILVGLGSDEFEINVKRFIP